MKDTMRHFISILDELIENNEFFAFYFQNPWILDSSMELSNAYNAAPDLYLECGASRGTLIDAAFDEVVKYPLSSYEYEDACETEVAIYNAAIECHLNKYFARPMYLGTYTKTIRTYPAYKIDLACDDWCVSEKRFRDEVRNKLGLGEEDKCDITIEVPLYAYPKATSIGFTSLELEDDEEAIATSYNSPLSERDEAIAASFVHEYGETAFMELSSFLNEWNVNDIHLGNIGWICGKIVLIDYAGYHNGSY